MIWEASNFPRFRSTVRIKFLISKQNAQSQLFRKGEQPEVCVRFSKGSYKRLLSVFGDEYVIRGDTSLDLEISPAIMDNRI